MKLFYFPEKTLVWRKDLRKGCCGGLCAGAKISE